MKCTCVATFPVTIKEILYKKKSRVTSSLVSWPEREWRSCRWPRDRSLGSFHLPPHLHTWRQTLPHTWPQLSPNTWARLTPPPTYITYTPVAQSLVSPTPAWPLFLPKIHLIYLAICSFPTLTSHRYSLESSTPDHLHPHIWPALRPYLPGHPQKPPSHSSPSPQSGLGQSFPLTSVRQG